MQGPSSASSKAEIRFPEASTLVLEDLPNLVKFASGDHVVGLPSLEDVTVNNCPKIQTAGLGLVDLSQLKSVDQKLHYLFSLTDKFSQIVEFRIEDAEELGKTLAMNLIPTHFTRLEKFEAKNCDERLIEFLSILLERSRELRHLTIKDCKLLKHVFDLNRVVVSEPDEEGNGKYFVLLKTMQLCNLPQLTSIWNKDPTGLLGLAHLENIEIRNCGSLKNLIPASAARNLKQLRALRLHSCETVEEVVVAMETQGLETQKRAIEFPKLEELELMDLSKLIKFYRGNCALEFPSLKYLRIKNCPQMMAFMTGFASAEELSITDKRSFNELKELELDTCGKLEEPSITDKRSFNELEELELDTCDKLKYVIPSMMLPRFQKLVKLIVSNCYSLAEVIKFHGEEFASTKFFQNLQILQVKDCDSLKHLFLPLVPDSPMLREIKISDCKALEDIFVTKGKETSGKFLFSKLSSIAFENLPKLSTFSLCTFEFPSLERLQLKNCPALKTFVSKFPEMEDHPAASSNFFENFDSLVKLRSLVIINQTGVDKLWHNKHQSKSIYELEELTLNRSSNLLNVIPSSMLIRFNKLKSFIVDGCEQLKEVFELEDHHDAIGILPQLDKFALICLPSLVHVWNKEPRVPVFQNLVSLQIIECDRLTKLFSLSTAKHLQQLELLKLYACKNLKEVFVDEEGIGEVEFDKVECLVLKDLQSLASFCGQSTTFSWPKLRKVRVCEIPKMKTFSEGNQITPLLRAVNVTFIKKCWRGDLNSTIQYLHNNPEEFEKDRAMGKGTSTSGEGTSGGA